MRKLNQTEIKALARSIIRRVNTKIIAHNEKLKTSNEYEEFKEEFPATKEGKDAIIHLDRIKTLEDERKEIDMKINTEKEYLKETYQVSYNTSYRAGQPSSDPMEQITRNARSGKFKEKEQLSEHHYNNSLNDHLTQISDKLTIAGVSDMDMESKSDEIAWELFKSQ